MPLKVGNSWEFDRSHWWDTASSDYIWYKEDQWSDTIVGRQTVQGEEFFLTNSIGPSMSGPLIFRYRSDGLISAELHEGQVRHDLFFKESGDTITSYLYTTMGDNDTVGVAITSETLTVPAGSFECYSYRISDHAGSWIYSFALGVGMVRGIYINDTTAGVTEGDTLKLTSFELK